MYRSRLILLAVLVLGASLVFTQAVFAIGMRQGAGPGMMRQGGGPGMMMPTDEMTKALNLTPDQVSKIQAIHSDARTKMQAVLADKSLTDEARRTKLMELRNNTHTQVMGVLTPDQQAKWKEFAAARKAQGFDRMSKMLGLTPTQQAQLKTLRDTERANIEAVRKDKTLSEDAKMGRIREIRTAAQARFLQMLTPEQRAKFDAAHSRMDGAKTKTY